MTAFVSRYEKPYSGEGSGNQQEYTREFEVRFTDGGAVNSDAVTATGVPILSGHPENVYALAYKAKAKQRDDVCFWDVTIEYKTFGRTYAEEEKFNQPNPTLRTAEVSISSASMRVPVPWDRDGLLIKNSAGQVPDPRLEADAELPVYEVKANVYPLPDWIDTYRNKYGRSINAASFKVNFQNGQYKTIPAGCARLAGVRSSKLQIENGQNFFEVSFSLLIRSAPPTDTSQDGWCFDMADMGKMSKVAGPLPSTGITLGLVPILGQDGQPVSEPVLLNGEGYAAPASSGAWSGATAYVDGDCITDADIDYICISGHTNHQPPNATYWQPLPVVTYWDYLKSDDFTILPGCSA